jgi:TetR/AcrR family transcriptional regulator
MPRTEVIANQRERLFGAIFAIVAEKGYEASTVADVVKLSGVSRSAFYEHFSNKGECLAAAAAELIDPTMAELQAQKGGEAALRRLLELLDRQPAAARVCFVELQGAGAVCEAVADRAMAAMRRFATAEIETSGGWRVDPDLAPVLIGGVHKLIQTRLCRDEAGKLAAIAPELWQWLQNVVAPPEPLVARRGRGQKGAQFPGYTPAERIAKTLAKIVAERGYLEMSTDEIAAQASISLSTFYAHFSDKHDAMLAALEMSGAQIMALAGPAARRAANWQSGVQALYEAICAYFSAEPELAWLATRGINGAGPAALARRDRVIDSLAAMLAPGFEENPAAPALTAEAAAAAGYAVIVQQVRREGPESLAAAVPLATYITLVGFVGPGQAAAVANAEGGR